MSVLISLVGFVALNICHNQSLLSDRLRTLELNQARIMERLGITNVAKNVENPP